MVARFTDFHGALDEWLVRYVRFLIHVRAHRWKDVHSIAHHPETALGAMALRWWPPPTPSTLATLCDWVESQEDPELVRGFAALLQRASVSDPAITSSIFELASNVDEVGRFGPGCAGASLQAHDELDRLLEEAAGEWTRPAEVLGVETHAHPEDLLNLAWSRLIDGDGRWSWCDLLTVIHKLRPLVRALRSQTQSPKELEEYDDDQVPQQLAWLTLWAWRSGLDMEDLPNVKAFFDDLRRRWPWS